MTDSDKELHFTLQGGYAEAPEARDHFSLKETYGNFINGKFTEPQTNSLRATINPATEAILAHTTDADTASVDSAVAAARTAFEPWARLQPRERAKYLYRIARVIQERAREFAIIESLDGGKPIRESRDIDVPLVAAHFFYYAGWADKLDYAFPGRTTRPLGVCGQIIPWNFPLLMAAWKIAPALATGNTVILKPAETTPLTALKLAELLQDVGLPPGVVNIITGGSSTGTLLAGHTGIDKIAFTGSTDVGKLIQKTAAQRNIPVTLELGGKAAHIIFADADLDQAVEGIVNGIFFNQGHVCCAGSRLLVEESVSATVTRRLKDRMQTLVVGDPLDKNTDIGAINSKEQKERIDWYLSDASNDGTEIFQTHCPVPEAGYWVRPTLLLNVNQSHRAVQEEIFGPVLAVQTFRTIDEAIELANNTPYGLSGGVWTQKGSKIFHVTRALRAGVLWANTYNKFDPTAPFGGYKESGLGREGGLHGLLPYVTIENRSAA